MKPFIHTFISTRNLPIALALLASAAPVWAEVPATTTTTTAPATTIDPQAKALLAKIVESYRNLNTLSAVVERSGRRQQIEFRAPQSLKVTSVDATGAVRSQQFFGAGETVTLQKVNDVYEWKTTPQRPIAEGAGGRASLATSGVGGLVFSNLLAGIDPFGEDTRYAGSSISLGEPRTVGGENLIALVVTPAPAERAQTTGIGGAQATIGTVPIQSTTGALPLNSRRPQSTITLLVSPQDSLVREVHTDTRLPNGTAASNVEKFTKLAPNADLPEAGFTFTPPAGANKVDNFSPARVRATVGQLPLPINTKDILGKDISFEQYKGKVVLVDFWATWCGPCIAELPNVKANYEKYHDQGFEVLGISLDRSTDPLNKYIQEKALPWRQIFDGYWDGPIATAYNVRAIPSTLIIGKDGKVAAIGARGEALEPAIKAALAQ
jgi:thiol-disulfide isomerase/thioredoxin